MTPHPASHRIPLTTTEAHASLAKMQAALAEIADAAWAERKARVGNVVMGPWKIEVV
jgi:hypothetical protein